jgi:CheY-like chemotaxis protein
MSNKRFALIGLNGAEAYAISDMLAFVFATADRLSEGALGAGVNALAPYDGCIVAASRISADGSVGGIAWPDLDRLHVLAIADEAQLRESDFASAHLRWELIIRPLRTSELLTRLSRLMCRGEHRPGFARPNDSSHRVLVVDDDETVRALLSGVLQAAGFNCDCVPNASEALAAVAGGHHELVLLDIGMPDIDGFKVLKALRAANPAHSPAVIMVTGATGEESILRGFGLGADDYVTKPFNPRELVARCLRAIRSSELANVGRRESARTHLVSADN